MLPPLPLERRVLPPLPLERRVVPPLPLRDDARPLLLRRDRLLAERLRVLPPPLRERLVDPLERLDRLLLDLLVAMFFFSYRECDRERDRPRGGTLAPFRRALLSPIAMACLRFLTGCLPDFMWCISVRTSSCALRPYLWPREPEREEERCEPDEDRDEEPREDDLRAEDRLDELRERDELREDLLLAMRYLHLSDACGQKRVGAFVMQSQSSESRRCRMQSKTQA